MFIQQTERTSLELGEDVESGRVADFFRAERGQIIRWKFYATEVFSGELLSGRPEGDVQIQCQDVVQHLQRRVQNRSFHNLLHWLVAYRRKKSLGHFVKSCPTCGGRPDS